jgi:transcriptional regulator with XRE-family HTH domain
MEKPAKLQQLYANIGHQIRETRTKRGITLEELAGRVGRDWSYISQIERAKGIPSIETLFNISEELQIHLSSLFETHKPTSKPQADTFSSKILYILKDASPKEKKTAISVLKKIFNK